MQQRSIKVLLVDPDERYVGTIRETLSDEHEDALEFEWAGDLSEALARLTHRGPRDGAHAVLIQIFSERENGSAWVAMVARHLVVRRSEVQSTGSGTGRSGARRRWHGFSQRPLFAAP